MVCKDTLKLVLLGEWQYYRLFTGRILAMFLTALTSKEYIPVFQRRPKVSNLHCGSVFKDENWSCRLKRLALDTGPYVRADGARPLTTVLQVGTAQ